MRRCSCFVTGKAIACAARAWNRRVSQTELECLGREVDPHFLFNNLNALTHLIEHRSDAAPWFIRTLSATYRYVLECRGRTLVPLADELEALERHRALADIRYAGGVHLDVEVQSG